MMILMIMILRCDLLLLQVELLLTLEEFCGEEGVFEQPEDSSNTAAGGATFAPLFANILQLLYDGEIVEEAAITSWADEKEHADENEKVFLHKVSVLTMHQLVLWSLLSMSDAVSTNECDPSTCMMTLCQNVLRER